MSIPIAWLGSAYLLYKYSEQDADDEELESRLRSVLKQLAASLKSSGEYLLGEFSFADIVAATMLQFVEPVENRFIFLGDQTRTCWTEPELAKEFRSLLDWRDSIYQKHRS